MLDWLRYFPLSLSFCRSRDYVAPKGPYLPGLRPHNWHLGDSVLHLSFPLSNPIFGGKRFGRSAKSISPVSNDLLQHTYDSGHNGGGDAETFNRWKHGLFFHREWFFTRPWFGGYASRLILVGEIVSPGRSEMFGNSSFFHPRVFENVIADYLDAYYGHKTYETGPMYCGPRNWQIIDISDSIQAVCCDILKINGDPNNDDPLLNRLIFIPVSDRKFLKFKIDFFDTTLKSRHVNPAPMFELTQSIIDSFRLEVGEKTSARWDEIKQGCPDMSLTKHFGQLQWPVDPDQIGKPGSAVGQIEQA